jgi:hypothetical protein
MGPTTGLDEVERRKIELVPGLKVHLPYLFSL